MITGAGGLMWITWRRIAHRLCCDLEDRRNFIIVD